jgi:hypothetical protein
MARKLGEEPSEGTTSGLKDSPLSPTSSSSTARHHARCDDSVVRVETGKFINHPPGQGYTRPRCLPFGTTQVLSCGGHQEHLLHHPDQIIAF